MAQISCLNYHLCQFYLAVRQASLEPGDFPTLVHLVFSNIKSYAAGAFNFDAGLSVFDSFERWLLL